MKIAIDATRAIIEKAGIGRVTYKLVQKLLEVDKKNKYLLIFSYYNTDPEKVKLINEFKKFKNVETKIIKIPGQLKEVLWLFKSSWLKNIVENSDVFLAPSCFEYNFSLKIPQAVIIYDLSTFIFPKQQGVLRSKFFSHRIKKSAEKADKVISISQSTKNDLINIAKIPKEKIEVSYCGLTKFPKIASNLPEGLKPKQYILSVGTIEPRKNLSNLFKAYAKLSKDVQKKFPLIVVGAKGWNTNEIFDVIKSENLIDKIKFLGFQSDESLARLYKEAKLFIYPSFYEGFGLPIAEALQFGTPVITSNTSSMPEVGGKAAIYVNPNNPSDIAEKIISVLENKIDLIEKAKIGKEHIKKFSWKKMANTTLKILENLKK